MNSKNPKVDWYFEKPNTWQKENEKLRSLVLECGLTEELKWGCPCYQYKGTNVVLIHHFKDYCALLFHKGALLNDTDKILIQQTKHVQSARQIRFTSLSEVVKMKTVIKTYIHEAIEVEKAGLKVEFKKTKEFEMPEEFEKALKKNAALKKAFYALTPGRQRRYLLYFSSAKQAKTRVDRIQKYLRPILNGKGLDD